MSLLIDFSPKSPSSSPLRVGIGSAVLALTLAAAWMLTSESEAGLLPHQALMPAEEEIRGINSAIDDLNFPWLAVLTALESSTDESLRIIQLDADAHDRRLNLRGEARDGRAVLDLPGRLSTHSAVGEARVVSQSPADNGEHSEFPVRFELEVTLRGSDGGQP
jgi:hypothetical protein